MIESHAMEATHGAPEPARAVEVAAGGDVVIVRDVMVPMRDGVRLATDLYLPARNGRPVDRPLPAVLARTPYDKTRRPAREEDDSMFFARNGYVAAAQDCRGRFNSEGVFKAFRGEAEDGYDTVEWLAALPACDGRVGTHGCSYGAWVQLQLATQAPPSLRTMIPHTGPNNAFTHSMHVGGTRTLGLLRWHVYMMLESREAQENPAIAAAAAEMLEPDNFLRWAAEIPWRRGQTPLALAPAYEDSAFEFYFENNDYGDYWRDPSLGMDEYFDRYPSIPILWITGWYEVYTRSIVEGYRRMRELGHERQYLLAGPWTHHNFTPSNGDANYGEAAATVPPATDPMVYKLRWFDRWLKEDDSVDLGPPVKLFLMGGGDGRRGEGGRLNHGGAWRAVEALDEGVRALRLHLLPDGALGVQAPETDGSSTRYTYDPRRTVHSDGRCEIAYGPASDKEFSGMGPYDQVQIESLPGHGDPGLPIAARRDVAVFETPPLESDLTVAGSVTAVLFVSSDAPDTDFFVKLVDVYPPGRDYAMGYGFPVTDGIVRARYRESFESPSPLEAGRVYRIEIPLHPVGNRFARGHRIRVVVSSSSFPSYDVNPNTGDPVGRSWRVANNTIHHSPSHASFVELTVVAATDAG